MKELRSFVGSLIKQIEEMKQKSLPKNTKKEDKQAAAEQALVESKETFRTFERLLESVEPKKPTVGKILVKKL